MEPPESITIHFIKRVPIRLPRTLLTRAARYVLSANNVSSSKISVLFCDDDEIRQLNATYRQVNEPTDVLTFCGEVDGAWAEAHSADIAISVPYALRQANARKVSLSNEIVALLIHGVLHSVGYDDVTEPLRMEMMRAMKVAGDSIGLNLDPEWTSILHEEAE